MTNKEFVKIARKLATEYDTVYLWGTFGSHLTDGLITQKAVQYPKNYSQGRQTYLRGIVPQHPWAFDCVGLIKGILWGWNGDKTQPFGGACYCSNAVPDITAGTMAKRATERGTDFSKITEGEVVYKSGHIGIYVGDGTVVEATLTGKYDGVVLTDLAQGNWTEHGKLPWIEYQATEDTTAKDTTSESTEIKKEPQKGDIVTFSGGTHYLSANGTKGFTARPGPAKVTRYLPQKKHPYHLIHTDKTSNVYGWVDKDTVCKKN